MYRKHFGLIRKPFKLSPDSHTFFLGESHKRALAVLKQGVVRGKGFLLFTGGVGTGKTTLINVLSKNLDNPGHLCVISNPTLKIDDFFYYFAAQLGLLFDGNKARFLFIFTKLLEECGKNNSKILLIIDEAHALPTDLLEELRLLVNIAVEAKSVLSIFLVGQPELHKRLTEQQLAPLSRCIGVKHHLHQLSREDTVSYVLFRLARAGAENRTLFSESAMELIYQATTGNPRQINILCDNALLIAYARGLLEIDDYIIRECAAQLYIPGDKSAFYLPPPKPLWRKRVIWGGAVVVAGEIAVGLYVYYSGWLSSLYHYLKKVVSVG